MEMLRVRLMVMPKKMVTLKKTGMDYRPRLLEAHSSQVLVDFDK